MLVPFNKFQGFFHGMNPGESPCDVSELHWNKMSLIWRKREHEEQNMNAKNDPATI